MIAYAFLSIFTFGLLDNFRGPFFSQILHDLNVDDRWGAWFFAMTSGFACFASAYGAQWVRRWGTSAGLHHSAAFMVGGCLVISQASHFWILLVGAAIFGLGAGLGNYSQNAIVADFSLSERRSSVLSGLHAMYGLASMTAPWIAAQLMYRQMNWQSSFLLISAVPMALLIGGYWRDRRGHWQTTHQNFDHAQPIRKQRRRDVLLLATAMSLYLLAEISIGTRLVRWLEVDRQLPAETGSLYLAGFFSALLFGRLLSWWRSPHQKRSLQIAMVSLMVTGCLATSATLLFSPSIVILCGLILGPFYPLAISYLRLRFAADAPRALSMALSIGSLSVLLMHLSIGWLAERFGQTAALFLGPAGLALGALLLLIEAKGNQPSGAAPQ